MTKQEQIEEMAKEIEKAKQHIWASVRTQTEDEDYLWHSRAIAEHLTSQGYRKVSDNYIGTDKVLRSIDYRQVDEVRKETAEKILNELIESSNKITFFDCRMALGLDKLAKKYGVEIKE